MKHSRLASIALAEVVGVIAYCFLVIRLIFTPNGPVFIQLGEFVGVALFLSTFVFSAAIVGTIIFGYPITLFLSGQKKEAWHIVIWVAIWSIAFILVSALIAATLGGDFKI